MVGNGILDVVWVMEGGMGVASGGYCNNCGTEGWDWVKDGGATVYDGVWVKTWDKLWGGGGKTSDGVKSVGGNDLLDEV